MDKELFLSSFKEYSRYVYNYIYYRTGNNKEIAEDLTQETYVRAWKYRLSYNPKKSGLKVWLISIARNTCTDYYKKKRESLELDENLLPAAVDSADENRMDVEFILRKLNFREKEIMRLRYKYDLKISEIGTIMNENPNNLKVEIHRIIQRLKQIFNND